MRRAGQLGCLCILLGIVVGCGQEETHDLAQQEGNLRKHFELQKQVSTKLTTKERRIRQERLRMQFGDLAD